MKKFDVKNLVVAAVGAIVAGLAFLIKKNWEVIRAKMNK